MLLEKNSYYNLTVIGMTPKASRLPNVL